MATSQLALSYAEANAHLVDRARKDLRTLLSAGHDDAQMADLFHGLVQNYGSMAAALGAEFYDDARREAAPGKVFRARLADPPGRDDTGKAWGWAQSEPAKASSRLDDELQRLVLQAGRDTVADSAEADPAKPGWARVPQGKTCAFCTLLASRGIMYRSKKSALYRKDGRKYHNDCNCIAEPAFDDDDLSIDIQPHLDLYKQARKNAGSSDTKAILAAMRRIPGAVTDEVRVDPGADGDETPEVHTDPVKRPRVTVTITRPRSSTNSSAAKARTKALALKGNPDVTHMGTYASDIIASSKDGNLRALAHAVQRAEADPSTTAAMRTFHREQLQAALVRAKQIDVPKPTLARPLPGLNVRRPLATDAEVRRDAATNANPHFGTTTPAGDTPYDQNCQRCVMTSELRTRGYDVEAMPSWAGVPTANLPPGVVTNPPLTDDEIAALWGVSITEVTGPATYTTINHGGMMLDKVVTAPATQGFGVGKTGAEAAINSLFPVGARGWVLTSWQRPGAPKGVLTTRHIFGWERTSTGVRWFDPQDSSTDASKHFLAAIPEHIRLMRIDDAMPTDAVRSMITDGTATEGVWNTKKVV